jgi:hypothetical protein
MRAFYSLERSGDERIHRRHLRWWQQLKLRRINSSLSTLALSLSSFARRITRAFFLHFSNALTQLFSPLRQGIS